MTLSTPVPEMTWKAVGAWTGGTVVDVALNRGAGTLHGLLASRAGVYGWSQPGSMVMPLPQGMSDLDVVAVTFAGGNANTSAVAFAATATGRLFRSHMRADGMGHEAWEEVKTWAGLGVAVVLAPSPTFDRDQTLFVGTPAGIYRTQDNGQSWESCNFGLLDDEVLCMLCAPTFTESEVLWAGTAGGGLYRSRNSGRAWRESGIGLPDAAVQSLAVSPLFAKDRTVFVGMEAHGVYVSRNGGENWTRLALPEQSVNTLTCAQDEWLWAGTEDGLWRISTTRGGAIQVEGAGEAVLTVAATASGEVAVGLFGSGLWLGERANDAPDSMTWHKPEVVLHAPPVVTSANDTLYALDADGFIARSDAGGAQWAAMESANSDGVFALAGTEYIAGNGARAHTVIAATNSGLAKWHETSQAWEPVGSDVLQEHPALGVALSSTFAVDGRMLATSTDGKLLLSQDGGTSWQAIIGPWHGQELLLAKFAPENPNELAALSVQPTPGGHFDVSVWHTDDLGQHWEGMAGLSSGVPAVLMAWPEDASERALYLATQHRVIKLYYLSDPLTPQVHQHFFDESLRVTALATSPDFGTSNTIWAATTGGVYRSVDRGLSWGLVSPLPLDLPVVWLGVTGSAITAITLGGRVWQALL